MLAYVGVCWPILRATWAHLVAMLAYVGLMLTHVEPKDPKNGSSKKTQDILKVGGLPWGYVGPSWGYVGLSWGQCGPILRLCWPILGLCCPILGLCWPILGAMLPHLGAMLANLAAYVGPCWPILNHKIRKMGKNGKSTKHRKTRGFLAVPTLLRQGARPLSPTERRELPYGNATARGPLAGFMRLTPDSRAPAKADPSARAGVVVVVVVVVFGRRFAPVLALGCGGGCCCCGCCWCCCCWPM